MLFRQITHDDLGCASYLIGDEEEGLAAVVDPRLDIDEYLRLARYFGVSIEHIIETHNHADHVSGHGRLAAATGARIHIHEQAGVEYPHEPISDGWELELGSLKIVALHTPGHRPEHTAFTLSDSQRGREPWAVLSGDSLLVGDLARPDLAGEETEGAREIFNSLHTKLLALPGDCEVWPAHLGGSMCGGPAMNMKVSSTIGFERDHQHLLKIGRAQEFVERSTSSLPPQPPNFENIVAVNRGPFAAENSEARPLAPRQLEQSQRAGALVVDVRADWQFDEAHIPGALCITTLRAGFGSKLAWLIDPASPLLIVGRDEQDARGAVTLAAAVALNNVAGFLTGGMTSWREEERPVQETSRITVAELHERWGSASSVQVLDVRERSEWEEGHIPGAVHQPYHDIRGVGSALDPTRAVAVVCASGQRAAVGASLLQLHGARQVIHVAGGGVPLWQRNGWPLQRPRASAA